ncbi:hypothetical protein ABTZ03_21780 [Kitasatospora sp. NPDC096077]|uniref:hypothetical protein n=1 Tax=Kitasatospora sp. NPDC096077 TaxID=3155544 RepID=UPI003332B0B1
MSSSIRTKATRFLAASALAVVGATLVSTPAHAVGSLKVGINGAVVADAGQTLNVSVTYQCLPDFQSAAITVQGAQSGVSGRGSVHVPCFGGPSTVTVPVSVTSTDGAWTRSSVDLSAYIADAELNHSRATATVLAS